MPELPEVETIKRGLESQVVGQKIVKIELMDSAKTNFVFEDLNETVIEQKISSITRRGKVLIWNFESDYSLLFHLKMTGQVVIDGPDKQRFAGGHPTKSMDLQSSLPDNSTRAIFHLSDGSKIYFNDQRKFGWIKLLPTEKLDDEDLIAKMGPEPEELSDEEVRSELKDAFQASNRVVKAVLLDQAVLAGVGNIYADESLHQAKVHPERRSSTLTEAEVYELLDAVADVMARSIELGGTSVTNYVNVLGTRGDYLENSRVFKREGLNCRECGAEIIKTRVAGRGTHLCPVCQVL